MLSYSLYQKLNNLNEESYLALIDSIDFESVNEGKLSDLQRYFKDMYNDAKTYLANVKDRIGMDMSEIVEVVKDAFKNPTMLKFLKAVGFSFKKLVDAFNAFTGTLRDSILKVAHELNSTKALQKVDAGLMSIDEIINKYPVLKKVRGLALIGFIFWGWTQMTFIGDVEYDFNWSAMIDAWNGSHGLADALSSKGGTAFLALLVLGYSTGIGFGWLGLGGNIIFALIYTAYANRKRVDKAKLKKLQDFIRRKGKGTARGVKKEKAA